MDLSEFLDIMDDIGFDLIKYFADVYYRHETRFDPLFNIVDNEEMALTYSGCWYGGLFFEWIMPLSLNTSITNKINPWKIIHGQYSSNQECHYFLIITTEDEAFVLNTYGGINKLFINIISLDESNKLLKKLYKNKVSAIQSLFGFNPDY